MPIITPVALNPGDMYQLAFVSSTELDAMSADIADYNTHVQNAANANDIGIGSGLFGLDRNCINRRGRCQRQCSGSGRCV